MFATTGAPQVGQTRWVEADCGEGPVVFAFMMCLLSGNPGPNDGQEDAAHKNL